MDGFSREGTLRPFAGCLVPAPTAFPGHQMSLLLLLFNSRMFCSGMLQLLI